MSLNVMVRSCSKPGRWYGRYIGMVFEVERSLFGYTVAEGRHRGQLIYARDAAEYRAYVDEREGTVETRKGENRTVASPNIKVPQKGA